LAKRLYVFSGPIYDESENANWLHRRSVHGGEFAWDQPRGVATVRSERHLSSRSTKGPKSTRRASVVSKARTWYSR
jgi:hypothetical protein